MKLKLSQLGHTWIVDLDGTIVKHNGHLAGNDEFLEGALDFLHSIPEKDMLVILTSRSDSEKDHIMSLLAENGIDCDAIICGAPYGERILINDDKPSGLRTCIAVPCIRDEGIRIDFHEDAAL